MERRPATFSALFLAGLQAGMIAALWMLADGCERKVAAATSGARRT
jgi:hypothetical protein